ncbi:uncharacterized protein [Eurosta solidaginis]|uniref:uncharacterized protein n=1 Tax=Eurosta solidaginis TaxID=178769 RepID=UPI0035316038
MDVKMKRTQLNLFNLLCNVLCFLLFLKTTTTTKLNANELMQKTATHSFTTLHAKLQQQPHNNFQHHKQHLQRFKALLTTVDRIPLMTDPRSERLVALKQTNAINRRMRLVRAISENDDDDSNDDNYDNENGEDDKDNKEDELPSNVSPRAVIEPEENSEGGITQWISDNLGQIADLKTRLAVIIMDLFI